MDSPDADLAELVDLLQGHVPELTAPGLAAIATTVAPNPRTRRLMLLALRKRPGILIGQDPQVPRTVQALASALHAAGAAAVVVPSCQACGRQRALPHRAPGGGRHCAICEKHHRATECASCGQKRPVHRSIGEERICRSCWKADPRSYGTCSGCGLHVPVVRSLNGSLTCDGCYVPPQRQCFACQRMKGVALWLEGRPLCANCYVAMRHPHPCPRCARNRLLTHVLEDELCCADCAGEPAAWACPGCGSVENSRKMHLCAQCRRPEIVHHLLAAPGGAVRPQLRPLEAYLLAGTARGDSLERWQAKGRLGATALRELAEGTLALTPEAIFTRCGTGAAGSFLLNMLVASGVLPGINVEEERFQHWLDEWLTALGDPGHRLVLRRYARWGISTQPWAGHGTRPTDDYYRFRRLRNQLRRSEELLVFAESLGHSTLTLPQRSLDAHLAEFPARREHLPHFTRWLRKNGLGKATAPDRPQPMPGTVMDPDDRWRLARRLLHDTQIDPTDRVAGLLILLYGQTATRIVTLPRSAVSGTDEEVFLTLADTPIRLPEELGHALTTLFNRPSTTHADQADTWLFRGRLPGRHLTPGALGKRMSRIGVSISQARSATLLDLAAAMPVAVLADLLGLSLPTAARWSKIANRDWSIYPRLRT